MKPNPVTLCLALLLSVLMHPLYAQQQPVDDSESQSPKEAYQLPSNRHSDHFHFPERSENAPAYQRSVSERKDAFVWYFGSWAGLSFQGGTATSIFGGQVETLEGSAVICDRTTGELLFYTDGVTVWNRDHEVMPNGIGLRGHWTSMQSALIIRQPGHDTRYYVFTVGAGLYHTADDPNNGMWYSIVDMSADNGLGDVIEKNTPLIPYTYGTEMLAGTRHCNGEDYWILSHEWGTSNFHAYLLTDDGIVDKVISSIGEVYPRNMNDLSTASSSQVSMSISPNGRRIAVARTQKQRLELYDFDNVNGRLSNGRVLKQDKRYPFYDAEFSPDNSRLYVSTLYNTVYILQFDLEAGSPQAVTESMTILGEEFAAWGGGQIQMGPDGRLYVAHNKSDYLGVIAEPNKAGTACGYSRKGLSVSNASLQHGLPNFVDADVYGADITGGTSGSASIADDYSFRPDESQTIPVMLDNDLSGFDPRAVRMVVEYDGEVMQIENGNDPQGLVQGTLLDGWTSVVLENTPGRLTVEYGAPVGKPGLGGPGELLRPRFRMVDGPRNKSDLVLSVTFPGHCLRVSTENGLAQRYSGNRRKDAYIWYFGSYAGISFNDGAPSVLEDGKLNTLEGCATICDRVTGELLFYTDGVTVWNREHKVMPNGTDLFGHWTSLQSALIVKQPGHENRYYIFTVGAGLYHTADDPNNGMWYSVVDMAADGGRGDVVEKNTSLIPYNHGTEMLTGTRHCNGEDYWVLSHEWGTNNFRAYMLTKDGVSDPVITSIGQVYPRDMSDLLTARFSQASMSLSPNGRLLAVAATKRHRLELFDFNNQNGTLSNERALNEGEGYEFYDAEFSPDNTKLYVGTLYPPVYLFQFDLSAGNTEAIAASKTELYLGQDQWGGGQLQLGPDGRIYVAHNKRSYLGIITEPNRAGTACNYIHEGFSVAPNRLQHGLPNFIDADVSGAEWGTALLATMRIDRDHHLDLNRPRVIPVLLDQSLESFELRSIRIVVEYDAEIMDLENGGDPVDQIRGTLLEGWTPTLVMNTPGTLTVEFAAPTDGTGVAGPGVLLNLRFRMVKGPRTASELPLTVTFPGRCERIEGRDGYVSLAPSGVALEFGQTESLGYLLEVNDPNPFTGTATIEFAVGSAGPTRLEVFDAAGEQVAVLVDEYLEAGRYEVTCDGSRYPSGLYYYRLVSGHWSRTRSMILVK